jgi:hypothetical protein
MKRLLGGGRMKWAHPVAKFWFAGVSALALGVLGSLLFVQTAHAAVPASATFLNRWYIVDSNGQNYFDSEPGDGTFSYAEISPIDGCQDRISFAYRGRPHQLVNAQFFYVNRDFPNNEWTVNYEESTKFTSASGTSSCGSPSTNGGGYRLHQNYNLKDPQRNRRITFFKNNNDQIISFKNNSLVFSRKGSFANIPRYFRDGEVGDTANSCPDMILSAPVNVLQEGDNLFGSSGPVPGSSMLYAIRKDDTLTRITETYDHSSEPNQIGRSDCRMEADAMNASTGGHYSTTAYPGNEYDGWFLGAGLDSNGQASFGANGSNDAEDDDVAIIFVGTMANHPVDLTNTPISNPGNPEGGGDDKNDQQVCKGGALGWVVCPVVSAIQAGVDLLRDAMEYFLVVNPLPVGTGPIYESWNNIRNFSNIAFAIAFFAIIFSQATSVGISNYGIKRLLPRLILIAIASNLSYYICSFMVDAFNILGVGITSLLAIMNGGSAGTVDVSNGAGLVFTAGLTTAIIWAFRTGAIVQIFPLIAAGFIAFFITFIILVARQMFIILLVVFSPLAFVAGLLPGTQNWFRRWFDVFSTLLLMYPLIMAMFALARITSAIITSAA